MKNVAMLNLALAAALAATARANVVTVATNAGAGVDYTSIQAAIDALDNIDPAGDADPNSYHTINVAAGTYGPATTAESFVLHTNRWDGRGSTAYSEHPASWSLIRINDKDEDLDGDGSGNCFLDGLRLIGAGIDRTIIDGGGGNGRIMYIGNHNVHIEGMTLRNSYMQAPISHNWWWGGGLLVGGGTGGRVRDVKVENCDTLTGRGNHHCVAVYDSHNVVIDGMEITGYDGVGAAVAIYCQQGKSEADPAKGEIDNEVLIISRVLVANAHVHANGANGAWCWTPNHKNTGGYTDPRRGMFFGCLIENNTGHGFYTDNGEYARHYLVNCTIANNGNSACVQGTYGTARVLNSILSDNVNPPASSSQMYFMHNLLDQAFSFSGNLIDGYSTASGDDGTNQGPPVDPQFVAQGARDYRLQSTSPAVDRIPPDGTGNNAFVLTGGTAPNQFVYVDLDKNGVYDQQLDVIVKLKGYAPTESDWVLEKDVRGRSRLVLKGLDAGCYEFQPPGGTVVVFK